MTTISRALISVSDKTGILPFAQALAERGVEILSTGGTARLLSDNGVAVQEVSDYTGFPEMMDGRVKTLHPKIHGGILGRRGIDELVILMTVCHSFMFQSAFPYFFSTSQELSFSSSFV